MRYLRLVLTVMFCFVLFYGDGWTSTATTQEPPVASPSPSGSSTPSPSPSPLDRKSLLRAFVRAQVTEVAALKHRTQLELDELAASQKARLKEWQKKEEDARHQFFAEHPHGHERRDYMRDFVARRKALDAIFKDERTKRQNEISAAKAALQSDQGERFKEFQASLDRGERPPERLWPRE